MSNLVYKFAFLLFFACFQLTAFAHSSPGPNFEIMPLPKKVTLPAGTLVLLETTSNLKTDQATVGMIIPFRVTTNVIIDGEVVITSGTAAVGRVKHITPSTYNDPAVIGVEVKHVQSVDGQQVILSTNPIDIQGQFPSQGGTIQVGTVVTSNVMNDTVIEL